jgi:hypothetical protein
MKECTQCREMVRPDAAVCRYCHHRFTSADDLAEHNRRTKLLVIRMAIISAVIGSFFYWANQPGSIEGLGAWSTRADQALDNAP